MRKQTCRWLLILLLSMIGMSGFPARAEENQLIFLIDWSPDGNRVALSSYDGIGVYDSNFQPIGFFPNALDRRYSPDYVAYGAFWSPDGTRLTAGSMILDGKTLRPVVKTKAYFSLSQWSPDGKYVSTLAIDYRSIESYDAQTGNLDRNISFDEAQLIGLPILSPDGSRYVLNMLDTIGIADETGQYLALYKYPYRINALRLSPDGRRIAYQSTETVPISTPGSISQPGDTEWGLLVHAFIIEITTGKTLMQSEPLNSFLYGFQWSPDGTQIAGKLGNGTMVTWDTGTGKIIDTYTLPAGQVIDTWAYSSFGGRLTLSVSHNEYAGTPLDMSSMPMSNFNQTFLDGKIQVIVPAPSLERLKFVTQACKLQSNIQETLLSQIDTDDLNIFKTHVSALTNTDMPAGCQADLLAVADAFMAKVR